MNYNYRQYFNLITEGAGQRTFHPFELPKVNNGNDVLKLFEDIADNILTLLLRLMVQIVLLDFNQN